MYKISLRRIVGVRQLRSRSPSDRFRRRRLRSGQCRRVGGCGSRDRHPHPARLCRHFRRDVQRRAAIGSRLVDTCLRRSGNVLRGRWLSWTVRRHLADADQQ